MTQLYLDFKNGFANKTIMDFNVILQDQYGKFNKVPEWQRLAGKAAKEVEKFAKEKVDLVLMHWRDRMGIAQKEVKICIQTASILYFVFCIYIL